MSSSHTWGSNPPLRTNFVDDPRQAWDVTLRTLLEHEITQQFNTEGNPSLARGSDSDLGLVESALEPALGVLEAGQLRLQLVHLGPERLQLRHAQLQSQRRITQGPGHVFLSLDGWESVGVGSHTFRRTEVQVKSRLRIDL